MKSYVDICILVSPSVQLYTGLLFERSTVNYKTSYTSYIVNTQLYHTLTFISCQPMAESTISLKKTFTRHEQIQFSSKIVFL